MKFEVELDAKVQRLTELGGMSRPPQAEMEELKEALTAVTRCLGDPAGGGQMKDERAAFKNFMLVLKPVLSDWTELGEIHEDILDALLCPDPNVCLLASRGSAKSTITAMFATWKLWRDPEAETILIVSRSEVHSKKMLKAIKGYLEMSPLLEELRPEDDQLDSAFQLEVAPARGKLGMSTSVTVRGLLGQITGLRARIIIADDVEGPRDDTPEAIDRLEEAIAEFQHVAIPGATITLLGTPQSNFSLYGRLARNEEAWKVFRACLFTSDVLDKKEVFHSRWPSRFPPEDIEKRRRSVSKRQFALHYRLDLDETSDREQPFKLAALPVLDWPSKSRSVPIEIKAGGEVLRNLPRGRAEDGDDWRAVASVSPDVGPYTQVTAAVDPASGLRGTKHDAIGLAIVGITQGGRGIIRVAQGVRGDTTQLAIQSTARLIADYGANKLLVEETKGGLFGSMVVAHLAQIGHPLSYEPVQTGGVRKARRIVESISPALASGKLFLAKDVLTQEDAVEFVDQYTGITYDARNLKFDDIIDALSYAVADVAPALAADEAEFAAAARYTVEQLARLPLRRRILNEEELEMFVLEGEDEAQTKEKLDRALELQREEQARGFENASLVRRIAELTSTLTELQAFRRRVHIPEPYRRPVPKEATQ